MVPGSYTGSTSEPGSYTGSTVEPGSYTRSTIEPGSNTRSTAEPGSNTRSTSKPGSYTGSTSKTGCITRSTAKPVSNTGSTAEPGSYTGSTADPGSYTGSTADRSNSRGWKRTKNAATQCSRNLVKEVKVNSGLRRIGTFKNAAKKRIVKEYLQSLGHSDSFITFALNPSASKRKQYSKDDISTGLVLHNISPKAYKYLRSNKLLLLPCRNTLNKWLENVKFSPGLQEDGLNLVQKRIEGMDAKESLACLVFDEMEVNRKIEYDSSLKQVLGPCKKVQVVVLRGLMTKWKETIYYQFDQNISLDVLNYLIVQCEKRSIKIKAAVCDLGNKTLLSQINFSQLNNSIVNPADQSREVFFFPDAPHLMKLWRNHCIDKSYLFPDEEGKYHSLGKHDFVELMKADSNELKLCPKLKQLHVDAQGSERQRVRLAAELFSSSVSKALLYLYGDKMKVQSQAIHIVNSWFDVMNSGSLYNANPERCGFGLNLEIQMSALENMERLVKTMKFGCDRPKALLPYQKGILVSIKSMRALYADLTSEYPSLFFVLTRRLNQDCLENYFSQLRGLGGPDSHPSPRKAIQRIRALTLVKNAASLVNNPAVLMEEEEDTTLSAPFGATSISKIDDQVKKFLLKKLIYKQSKILRWINKNSNF